jgi:hypothetical protein
MINVPFDVERFRVGCQKPRDHADVDQIMCAWCWQEVSAAQQEHLKRLESRLVQLEARVRHLGD